MSPMLSEQVQIAIVQTAGMCFVAWIGYLKLRAEQKRGLAAIQDNTDKTVEVGVAVNGRVESLVNERVAVVEEAYREKVALLESQVATLNAALELAKKAKPKVA